MANDEAQLAAKPLSFPIVFENAYRVLGVNTAASRSDIQAAEASIKRSLKLGVAKSSEWDFPKLGPVERSAGLVQHAAGRLANVERRLVERLFGFGPSSQDLANAPSSDPSARHDRALMALGEAIRSDPTFADTARWIQAVKDWQTAVTSDDYWVWMLKLEDGGGFEPRANIGDTDKARRQAVKLAIVPIVDAAKSAIAQNDDAAAGRALYILHNSGLPEELHVSMENDVVGAAEAELTALCESVCKDLREKIVRERHAVKGNRAPTALATSRAKQEVLPKLEKLERMVGAQSIFAQRSRGDIADAMVEIAACWTWADDYVASEDLLKQAQTLAAGTPAEARVQQHIEDVKLNAALQRDGAKPIKNAPPLRTVNGIGTHLYSFGKAHPAKPEWRYATLYFVVLFIPLFPIKRYLVTPQGSDSWIFHTAVRFGIPQWIHLWVFVLSVLLFFRP
jgi:hypothetical protein